MSLTPINCTVTLLVDALTVLISTRADRDDAKARVTAEALVHGDLTQALESSQRIPGVSLPASRRIRAAFQLGSAITLGADSVHRYVRCAHDAVNELASRLRPLRHEEVWLIAADSTNRILGKAMVARGGKHGAALVARDVLKVALDMQAEGFVLAHNHPSGNTAPSSEDIHLTEQLGAASVVVGIPLIDHVIITRTSFSSMVELGLLDRDFERHQHRAAERHR